MCKVNFAAYVNEKTPHDRLTRAVCMAIIMHYQGVNDSVLHLTRHQKCGINIYTYCADPCP
jgi:hypothetical protein